MIKTKKNIIYGIEYYNKLYEQYKKVTLKDVRNFVEKYLVKKTDITAKFIPTSIDKNKTKGDSQTISDDYSNSVDFGFLDAENEKDINYYQNQIENSYKDISDMLKKIKSNIEEVKLTNGLTIYLVKNSISSRAVASIFVNSGYLYEEKPFVSDYTARMIFEGGPQIFEKNNIINKGGEWHYISNLNKNTFLTVAAQKEDIEIIIK